MPGVPNVRAWAVDGTLSRPTMTRDGTIFAARTRKRTSMDLAGIPRPRRRNTRS
jgi:hypothetical protein